MASGDEYDPTPSEDELEAHLQTRNMVINLGFLYLVMYGTVRLRLELDGETGGKRWRELRAAHATRNAETSIWPTILTSMLFKQVPYFIRVAFSMVKCERGHSGNAIRPPQSEKNLVGKRNRKSMCIAWQWSRVTVQYPSPAFCPACVSGSCTAGSPSCNRPY